MIKKHRYSRQDYVIDSRETMFQGFFRISKLILRHRLFAGDWSQPISRELFERGEAVGVLLFDPDHHLVGLVEQFRVGALNEQHGPWQYEVVAGMVEPGETPTQVALRELKEEAGVDLTQLIPICNYLVSAGGTDEKMHMFCGLCNLQEQGGIFGVEGEAEDILFEVWTYADVLKAQAEGLFNSAAATIALQWLQLNIENLTNISARKD
ncbi:MAG: NUDIX domain-containing protein [Porticoccaceae bacterium]|jgi:ADP-ribose pyrophosphatase|nr:NUDIX domain-containing protein [Porticoccaceae bacterium]MBT5577502.1 NUDIX domain-containing protein [Porticoccaceae bacterium]MBT7374458.1 NUDIX domain-containing protein [Porticoccaceae bacterium]